MPAFPGCSRGKWRWCCSSKACRRRERGLQKRAHTRTHGANLAVCADAADRNFGLARGLLKKFLRLRGLSAVCAAGNAGSRRRFFFGTGRGALPPISSLCAAFRPTESARGLRSARLIHAESRLITAWRDSAAVHRFSQYTPCSCSFFSARTTLGRSSL